MQYSLSDQKRVVYTHSDVDVKMYSLAAARLNYDDIDPLLLVCNVGGDPM